MNREGIIIKSQKELYYVQSDNIIYKSKARGLFRERNLKPLVGDRVVIQVLNDKEAYIEEIFDRKSEIVRPPVANINQILLVQSLIKPKINFNIFDKYLVMLEHLNLPLIIVVNKSDLVSEELKNEFMEIYSKTGYKIIFTSSVDEEGIEELRKCLQGNISVLAGPSGVGKSSLLNKLSEDINVQTGSISNKTSRGKHTTRHSELFTLDEDSFILDTPGFTSLNLDFIENPYLVEKFFPEFSKYVNECKFSNCQHINEPICGVKQALKENKLSKSRYENYLSIRQEILSKRRY
ncbi:MAG: ribosome small subunit-dependent GTPase A [Tissierellia bacterium]|nr:ribosome small subunit-dependent GTPase A [Tissierellia bacterium]